jgi:PAS domain S-box-containing protein
MRPRHDGFAASFDSAAALPLIRQLTQLHDAVLLLDASGRVLWMSDALAALCGGASRYEGRSWENLLEVASAGGALLRRLQDGGRLSNEPVRLLCGDGRDVQAWISAARLGPRSQACPSVAILRLEKGPDASRELPDARHYLSALLDSSPDAVMVLDASRFVTYVNPAMEALTGYPKGEILEKPLGLFVRRAEDLERIAAALDPRQPVRNHDLELRGRDGSPICVSVSASQMHLPDGSPIGTVAYLRDVTERRRNEEELARKNRELEHYVHTVSHDLRSPLVSLLGFTRLLREDYGEILGDKGAHFLNRVEQAGRTMENLIHDLLELSQIGRTSRPDTLVDPRGVLQQLSAELKPRLDAKGVRLLVPTDPPPLRCDRTRLYQIFSNLIGNALDHMGETEGAQVEVEIVEDGDDHEIRVSDNGRGIDARHHARIFEIFQSLAPRADGERGTGVGLSIVKKIAESHGGSVCVESGPGQGATFRVRLPGGRA